MQDGTQPCLSGKIRLFDDDTARLARLVDLDENNKGMLGWFFIYLSLGKKYDGLIRTLFG